MKMKNEEEREQFLCQFFVPWIGVGVNPSKKNKSWQSQMRSVKHGKEITKLVLIGERIKPINRPVKLIATPQKKPCNWDIANYTRAIKTIEDALVTCGILKNDTAKLVTQWTIKQPVSNKPDGILISLEKL